MLGQWLCIAHWPDWQKIGESFFLALWSNIEGNCEYLYRYPFFGPVNTSVGSVGLGLQPVYKCRKPVIYIMKLMVLYNESMFMVETRSLLETDSDTEIP